jgi:hypothetical protein
MTTLEDHIRSKARSAVASEIDELVGKLRRELQRLNMWIEIDRLPKAGDSRGNPSCSLTSVLHVIEDSLAAHYNSYREDQAVKEFFEKVGSLSTLDNRLDVMNNRVASLEEERPFPIPKDTPKLPRRKP